MTDPAMDCLFWTLDREPQLGLGERLAFLRARPHLELVRFKGHLTCEQTWKPDASALERAGWVVESELLEEGPRFDCVFLRPNRQREQILFDLARAASMVTPGGQLVVSLSNDCGAGRFEKELRRLLGSAESASKSHSRTFWGTVSDNINLPLVTEWLAGGQPRPILDGAFLSRPGTFSWDRIDPGSQLLTQVLPTNLSGRVADLGAGWGFLSHFLLKNRPAIHALDLFEADAEALAIAKQNLSQLEHHKRVSTHWHDVQTGLAPFAPYDAIVMNPPFHQGSASSIPLGQRFIAVAAEALKEGGQLWLVANQHLPYERYMRELLPSARVVKQENGFKILTASKDSGSLSPRNHRRS